MTQEKIIEMYKKDAINYKEKVTDMSMPDGYKINNVRYYNNIRVVTNQNDTELITVVEDKYDKALDNVNKGKCDEFYGNLRYEMHITRRDLKKINFLIDVDTIEEQSEPWTDVKAYEFLDKQLEKLMKEYGYM